MYVSEMQVDTEFYANFEDFVIAYLILRLLVRRKMHIIILPDITNENFMNISKLKNKHVRTEIKKSITTNYNY